MKNYITAKRKYIVLLLGVLIGLLAATRLSNLVYANHLTFSKGDIFLVADKPGTYNVIGRYSPSFSLVETLQGTASSVFVTPTCFDNNGNLYAPNWEWGNQFVSKFNNQGKLVNSIWASGFDGLPFDCVADQSGNVYVSNSAALPPRIFKFNAAGVLQKVFKVAADQAGYLALAADQCTLYHPGNKSVKRFNVCTNSQLPDFAASLADNCSQMQIRPNGEVLAACHTIIYRFSSSGAILQTYDRSNWGSKSGYAYFLQAIALDADGKSFWIHDNGTTNIYKLDIMSGKVNQSFTTKLNSYDAIAIFGSPLAAPSPFGPPVSCNCSAPDLTLHMNGSFYANGGFEFRRNLGGSNSTPAEVVTWRPDFFVTLQTLPAPIRQILDIPTYNWQEVAP